jgi:protein required for attachment to host cells
MMWLTRGDIEILLDRPDRRDFVVSAYADLRVKDGFHRQVDAVLRDQGRAAGASLADPQARRALEECVAKIRQAVDGADPAARGIAVFAGPARGLFHAVTLPFPVEGYLAIDEEPYVLPLLERWYGEPSHLVAVADSHQAVLFEAHAGTIQAVAVLERELDDDDKDTPRQHDRSQFSFRKRYADAWHERLRAQEDDVFFKGIARQVAERWAAGSFGGLILLGQSRNVAALRRLLPRDVQGAVVESASQAMTAKPDDVADDVQRALESWRSERRTTILGELQDRWKENHLVANGPTEVLDALQQGRAAQVVIGPRRDLSGARCGDCGYRFGAPVGRCVYCQGATQAVNAVQEILRMALRHRVAVHLFERNGTDPLAPAGGVAALLRAEANWAPVGASSTAT